MTYKPGGRARRRRDAHLALAAAATDGSAAPLLDGVSKIAVLGPNSVGDFMFTLPALHALKTAYPGAQLSLLAGKPWHAPFLHGRPGPVDRVLELPPIPGVGLHPAAQADPAPAQRFIEAMRAEHFDIAAQMFGGGRYSNPLVAQFGARLSIGARADDAPPLDRWVPFAEPSNRRLALLEVASLAGANVPLPQRELSVTGADRLEADAVLRVPPERRLVILQPGATDRRRCWPAASFAALGDALARGGALVAVNGTEAEAPLVRTVVETMQCPALDLSGRLSLRGLCGLIERAALVVSNDTGPLHLALAIGTPAVGIFWLTNLINAIPLRQGLLRAALAVRVHCPVCGAENLRTRCPHDESFVAEVPVDEVTSMATSLLRAGR
jgi:ADP-heptose:LPS heptosyltransferase